MPKLIFETYFHVTWVVFKGIYTNKQDIWYVVFSKYLYDLYSMLYAWAWSSRVKRYRLRLVTPNKSQDLYWISFMIGLLHVYSQPFLFSIILTFIKICYHMYNNINILLMLDTEHNQNWPRHIIHKMRFEMLWYLCAKAQH